MLKFGRESVFSLNTHFTTVKEFDTQAHKALLLEHKTKKVVHLDAGGEQPSQCVIYPSIKPKQFSHFSEAQS